MKRGLDHDLASQVAEQLMLKDALSAHAREELGISEITTPRPVQAALASAGAFSIGAAMPLVVVIFAPSHSIIPTVSISSLACLALLGAIGAKIGGAPVLRGVARVTLWSAFAIALTAGIGKLVGTVV